MEKPVPWFSCRAEIRCGEQLTATAEGIWEGALTYPGSALLTIDFYSTYFAAPP